ncbi:hypothetical protein K466DRAFT_601473 [Polyporus arcularius HHB13444]|uniref:Uncharacterized protein n=1 Tax=Polyporus arcularius HHB13444 TaxID=1314778 RepID=A0A5C3P925_9APHY|nr:hypothetical protein K466DRAFT_601473 [Polyporus arcularius HHB13444]
MAHMANLSSYDEPSYFPFPLLDHHLASHNDNTGVPIQWFMPQYTAVVPLISLPQPFLLNWTSLPACIPPIGGFAADVAYNPNIATLPLFCSNFGTTQSLAENDAGSPVIRAPQPIHPISFDAILAECASSSSTDCQPATQSFEHAILQSSSCAVNVTSTRAIDDPDSV